MAIISSFLAMFCGLVISIIGLRLDLLTYVGSFQFTTPCRSIQNLKVFCTGIQDTKHRLKRHRGCFKLNHSLCRTKARGFKSKNLFI